MGERCVLGTELGFFLMGTLHSARSKKFLTSKIHSSLEATIQLHHLGEFWVGSPSQLR